MASDSEELKILISAELGNIKTQIAGLGTQIEGVGKSAKKAEKDAGDFIEKFEHLKNVVQGFIGLELAKQFYELAEAGAEFLKINEKFTTVFGDIGDEAGKVRDELTSAYNLPIEAATTLLAKVGDITEGLGANSKQALETADKTVKYAKVLEEFGKGKTEQNVDVITKAFIGNTRVLRELDVQLTEDDLKRKAQKQGLVDATGAVTQQGRELIILQTIAEQNANAFKKFNDGQKSTKEAFETIENAAKNFRIAFGVELAEGVKGGTNSLANFLEKFGSFSNLQFVALKTIQVFKLLGQEVKIAFEIMTLPLVAVGEAAFKAGKFLYDFANNPRKAIDDFKQGLTTFGQNANIVFQNVGKAATSFGSILSDALHGDIGKAKADFVLFQKTGNDLAESLKNAIPLQTLKYGVSEIQTLSNNAADIINKNATVNINTAKKEADGVHKARVDGAKLTDKELEKIQADYEKFTEDKTQAEIKKIIKDRDALLKYYQQDSEEYIKIEQVAADKIGEINAAQTQKKLHEIEDGFSKAEQFGNDFASAAKAITDQQVADGKLSADQQKQILKDTAIAQKAISLINVGIKTAEGIASELPKGFPLSIPGIAFDIATGAAQAAAIIATTIPSFAQGTNSAPGGLSLIGEKGPELLNIPQGSQVIPNSQIAKFLPSPGGRGTTINNSSSNRQSSTVVNNHFTVHANNEIELFNRIKRKYGTTTG